MKIAGNQLKHLRDFYFLMLRSQMEDSEIDAQFALVVEHFLGIPKSQLNHQLDAHINQSELLDIYDSCKAIAAGTPVQYVLEEAYFYDLKLKVGPSVLIPRPETEELVHTILHEKIPFTNAIDFGTGSGCIPLALKKHRPNTTVRACDISDAALSMATNNARNLKLDIQLFKFDILKDSNNILGEQKFDLIISNPPYILTSEQKIMAAHVLEHEPHLALFVEGDDAILFYRKIILLCEKHLKSNGHLFFELNPLTAEEVRKFAEHCAYFSEVKLMKDMSGKWRFLKARKK